MRSCFFAPFSVPLFLACAPTPPSTVKRPPAPAPCLPSQKPAKVQLDEPWPGSCPGERPERCVVMAEAQRQLGQRMNALASALQGYVAAARRCTKQRAKSANATPPLEVVDRARGFIHREFFFPDPPPVPRSRVLGLERTLRHRCTAGDLDACVGGALLDNGLRRFERAARMLRRACDKGHALACARLAYAYNHGLGVMAEFARAAAFLHKSVDLGCARGMTLLGDQLWLGMGLKHDLCRAMDLYEQACRSGDQLGCAEFGARHCSESVVAKRDERLCADLPEAACRRHNDRGCLVLAGKHQAAGRSLAAFDLIHRACANGTHAACGSAAFLYGRASVVGGNPSLEERLLENACLSGVRETCELLGISYEKGDHRAKDMHKANDYYRRGCKHGDHGSCNRLARSYYLGRGVPMDRTKARQLRTRAEQFRGGMSLELLQQRPVVKCKRNRKKD